MNDTQSNCDGSFTEILPRLERGLREYGQSADWEVPAGDYSASGSLFDRTLAERNANHLARLPVTLRSSCFIPPSLDVAVPTGKPVKGLKYECSIHSEGNRQYCHSLATGSRSITMSDDRTHDRPGSAWTPLAREGRGVLRAESTLSQGVLKYNRLCK